MKRPDDVSRIREKAITVQNLDRKRRETIKQEEIARAELQKKYDALDPKDPCREAVKQILAGDTRFKF